jgi:hypothetical protein
VTNVGTDRHQLANMAGQARDEMAVETLDVVADRGYYEGAEIMTCEEAGITVTLPKPMTSGAKAAGRFGKQDFVHVAAEDVYRCPADERRTYRYQSEEDGKTIRRYWTSACKTCALKAQCTTGPKRRILRWEHEAVLEKVQDRLDHNPNAMGVRRQTAEHPFGTIKCWMGATHFLTKRLPKVATEMALNVLAYNMKRVMAILGEVVFFRTVAGRGPPTQRVRELWIVAGRRAGKDSVASVIAAHAAALFDQQAKLRPGERAAVLCLACDRDQARIVLGYIKSYFEGCRTARG